MPLITLKRRRDFQRVSLSPKKWASPFFILQAASRTEKEFSTLQAPDVRFGFIITKKLGNAVTRNRIRRRLKAALQLVLKTYSQKENLRVYDVVVIARQASFSAPFEVLLQTVEKALEKVFLSDKTSEESSQSLPRAPSVKNCP